MVRAKRQRLSRHFLEKSVLYIILIASCMVFFGPIFWTMLTSLKTEVEIYTHPPTFLPKDLTFGNYQQVLNRGEVVQYIANSLIITLSGTIITIFIAILAGFSISRYTFIGRETIFLFILITRMIPPITLVVPFYKMLSSANLIDTKVALIVLNIATSLPSAIWILATFFRLIPKELEDAARIDGCSHLGTLRNVIIPLSIPSIATVVIFTFVGIWNEYLLAATFSLTKQARPLTVFLAELLKPEHQMSWGIISSVAVLIAVPTLIIAIFLQKYIVSGLLTGAIKG